MADQPYRLQTTPGNVSYVPDGVTFVAGSGNRYDVDYQAWLADGNTPDPADMSAQQAAAFAAAEDAERLRIVNERAQTDPAYAALADFVLRGVDL